MNSLEKLNIVYVIDYLFSVNGGTERQLHRLIQGMVDKGHRVKQNPDLFPFFQSSSLFD